MPIEELKTFEESYSRDLLLSFLSHGIAIHNADLSWEERDFVERYYRKGEIRILLSTSTLAMGINLPARNVFIPEKKWNTPRTGSQIAMTDISKAEHENMGGRAGRLGFVDEFGRAILVTSSPFHKNTFYDYYVKGGFEKLKPALNDQDIDLYCLDLIASGICSHEETIKNFLLSTYTGVSCWNGVAGRDLREVFAERVQKIIEKCLNWGLLKRDVQERLQVTERGKVTAQMGISIDTCLNLIKWMDLCDPARVSELEILVAARAHRGRQGHPCSAAEGRISAVQIPKPFCPRSPKSWRVRQDSVQEHPRPFTPASVRARAGAKKGTGSVSLDFVSADQRDRGSAPSVLRRHQKDGGGV